MDTITDIEKYPTEEDLSDSALAFLRLQETYKFDASELSSGIIGGLKTSKEMSWHDCFQIGEKLYELGDHNHTQEWLRESYQRFYPKFSIDKDSIEILENIANMSMHIHDVDMARNISETILNLDPENFAANAIKEILDSLPKNFNENVKKPIYNPSIYLTPEDFRNYEAVCRDDLKPPPSEVKDLYCMYASYDNAFLKLAPFQLEILNFEPRIVIYHNVMYESEIEYFKQTSISKLERSTVGSESQKAASTIRTSHSTFLPYKDNSFFEKFNQRVADMTNQVVDKFENIQVANYGMGGHYEPHFDCFTYRAAGNSPIFDDVGDRISTAMFYLNDVELGGSTAFHQLRLNVKPEKGSMVFWYNLHAAGNIDYRNRHAGCPVIKGSKWILNIWQRSHPQMFHRKCELEDDTWKSEKFYTERF